MPTRNQVLATAQRHRSEPRYQLLAALYVDAGCKPSSYRMIAEQLGMQYTTVLTAMRKPRVQAHIREMLTAKFSQLELSSQRVMQELATISFANVKDIFDEEGDIYATHMLPDHVGAAIQAIEVEKRVDLASPRGPRGRVVAAISHVPSPSR